MTSAGEHSTWRFLGVDGEPAELTHSPRLRTDDLFTLRLAALLGIGAVLVPHLIVAKDLECGALIRAVRSLLDSLSEGLTVGPAPENQI
jgi:DNA-binding transcriptional LysR family regulator